MTTRLALAGLAVALVATAARAKAEEQDIAATEAQRFVGTERRMKVSSDISCGMCRFVAEDLWTSLVGDWARMGERGSRARRHGAHKTARAMVEQLCHPSSPILPHFVDMYDIQPCTLNGKTRGGVCRIPGRKWYVKRDGVRATAKPPMDAKALSEAMESVLGDAISTVFKDDGSLAAALAKALGGKDVVDPDTLSELIDSAMGGDLDSADTEHLKTVLSEALVKRAALRNPNRPVPPRKKTDEERKWHLKAYQDVCTSYLREVDDVFTLAVGKEFEVQADAMDELAKLSRINWERADVVDPTWKPGAPMPAAMKNAMAKVEAVTDAGKAGVRATSCAEVCEEEDTKKDKATAASMKKKKNPKKKKAKDSKAGKKTKKKKGKKKKGQKKKSTGKKGAQTPKDEL